MVGAVPTSSCLGGGEGRLRPCSQEVAGSRTGTRDCCHLVLWPPGAHLPSPVPQSVELALAASTQGQNTPCQAWLTTGMLWEALLSVGVRRPHFCPCSAHSLSCVLRAACTCLPDLISLIYKNGDSMESGCESGDHSVRGLNGQDPAAASPLSPMLLRNWRECCPHAMSEPLQALKQFGRSSQRAQLIHTPCS